MSRILNLKKYNKTNSDEAVKTQTMAENLTNFQSLEWSAPEFTKYQKDVIWFLIGGAIGLGLLIFSLLNKNFIFALIVILSAFSLYVWSQKEPRKIKFVINVKGIMIDNACYNFDNLKSFWIFYEPPEVKFLSLESKKTIMPHIKIPLGEIDPNKIRELLLKFLPEEKQEESLIDVLARNLKF